MISRDFGLLVLRASSTSPVRILINHCVRGALNTLHLRSTRRTGFLRGLLGLPLNPLKAARVALAGLIGHPLKAARAAFAQLVYKKNDEPDDDQNAEPTEDN